MLPSRRRWDTWTAATRGVSCSAIETTTWEYASRAAISGWDERARVSVIDASLLQDYTLTPTNILIPPPPRRKRPRNAVTIEMVLGSISIGRRRTLAGSTR